MSVRLVLFDLVGTLLDEESDYEALDGIMAETVDRFRLTNDPEELSGEFTLAFMEVLRGEPEEDDEPATFIPFQEAAKEVWSGLLVHHGIVPTEKDIAWFWDTYLDIQRRTWRAYPEVVDTLKELQSDNVLIGIVTDADRYMLEDVIPAVGIEPYIDLAVSAEEAGHAKPHPALFRLALERTGIPASEVVMVGDSYERDVEGARGAGILRTVLVDRHGARTVAGPVVRDLRPVPRVVHQAGNGHETHSGRTQVTERTRAG
ncbi:MAG: HAD family hydrolase [Euryarchaeota archaeon]|nr:HAD family hydrolase [Euryarchaeota archaeon]